MEKLAKKFTAWFQSDLVLKIVSIASLVFAAICYVYVYFTVYTYDDFLNRTIHFYIDFDSVIFFLINISTYILFVLYAFILRKKMKTKSFCMLYFVIEVVKKMTSISFRILIGNYYDYFILFEELVLFIATSALTAMILFALLPKNDSPDSDIKSFDSDMLSPDRALKLLNDKLELGIITKEEYQAERAKIISRL